MPFPYERRFQALLANLRREGRYRVVMEVITDPHQACLLLDTRLEGDADLLRRLRLFVLLSPHLAGLWTLDLSGGNFTDKTAQMIASATPLSQLRQLNLTDNKTIIQRKTAAGVPPGSASASVKHGPASCR